MKVVFVSYNNQPAYNDPALWIERIKTFSALMSSLAKRCTVGYLKQIGAESRFSKDGVDYFFLRSGKNKNLFPRQLNKALKQLDPDIVIISGILFPLQIIQLRWALPAKTKLIGRHHAETAPRGIRKLMQQYADKCINAYLFTSLGNAKEWLDSAIIKKEKPIFELTEASTDFKKLDKQVSRNKTGMTGHYNFLWVGRLNENKDPQTVLNAFAEYLSTESTAKLYMIFQENDMLPRVKQVILKCPLLQQAVILVGIVNYNELPSWYCAADFFISASHREGGSYALLEAMACGCIPIITSIPAALKMTDNGKYAIVFEPGNEKDLTDKLRALPKIQREQFSAAVEKHFTDQLSSDSIAAQLYSYCCKLL